MRYRDNWWASEMEPRGFTCRTRAFSLRDIVTIDLFVGLANLADKAYQLDDASAERLHYELRKALKEAAHGARDREEWPLRDHYDEIKEYAEGREWLAENNPVIVNGEIRRTYQKDIEEMCRDLRDAPLLDNLSDDELVRLYKEVEFAKFVRGPFLSARYDDREQKEKEENNNG